MVFIYKGVKFHWSFRKFLVNCLVCSLILLILGLYLTNAVKATSGNKVNTIIVRQGQTLWSIARQIAPEQDPRDVITRIKLDNQLRDSRLTAGQTLKITVFE
ncbi:MAG: LysM peptidoglycan-binding domain-containing protein [Bacteroidota bacterium]